MMKLLKLLTIVIMISSCMSPAKHLNKAYDKSPVDVAKFCKDKFPCITNHIDTVTKVEYDFVEVACPGQDTVKSTDTLFIPVNAKPKTYILTKTKFIASPVQTRDIITVVKDSALISYYQGTVSRLETENKKLYIKLDKKNDFIKWLIISLALSLFLNLLFITNKK